MANGKIAPEVASSNSNVTLDSIVDAAVERTIRRLLPHLEPAHARFIDSKNAKAETGQTWRSIDDWGRRQKLDRLKIAGRPAYRAADIFAAIEATATVATKAAETEASIEDLYLRAAGGARK